MLENYSGEFDPNLRFENFSKNVLIDLLKLYGKLYQAVDGFWYLAVKDKFDNEAALDCDIKVWERFIKYELDRITKLFKMEGNDVATFMKAFQVEPFSLVIDYEIELKSKNDAVLTITSCPTLASIEREGTGREEPICNTVDSMIFRKFAEYFNPNIEVIPLRLPPREKKEGVCCQWGFSLKMEGTL